MGRVPSLAPGRKADLYRLPREQSFATAVKRGKRAVALGRCQPISKDLNFDPLSQTGGMSRVLSRVGGCTLTAALGDSP